MAINSFHYYATITNIQLPNFFIISDGNSIPIKQKVPILQNMRCFNNFYVILCKGHVNLCIVPILAWVLLKWARKAFLLVGYFFLPAHDNTGVITQRCHSWQPWVLGNTLCLAESIVWADFFALWWFHSYFEIMFVSKLIQFGNIHFPSPLFCVCSMRHIVG